MPINKLGKTFYTQTEFKNKGEESEERKRRKTNKKGRERKNITISSCQVRTKKPNDNMHTRCLQLELSGVKK